ncbi:hypothetical protein P8Q88_00225 [Qipengyuania sp. XHP0207]|uniref:hypothetical protein n=1 Tax=Qipengyuania sp. XHP0207 TaxID=3038078 RepID=UPI00241E33B9|nr:hypothetical protein [Qipengyuania sp. XHP0207]MDG5746597.1 hypothetical protein [Qipengyuania sp. XHP0207]
MILKARQCVDFELLTWNVSDERRIAQHVFRNAKLLTDININRHFAKAIDKHSEKPRPVRFDPKTAIGRNRGHAHLAAKIVSSDKFCRVLDYVAKRIIRFSNRRGRKVIVYDRCSMGSIGKLGSGIDYRIVIVGSCRQPKQECGQ